MLSIFWDGVFIKPLTNLLIFLTNIIPGHDLGMAIIALTIIIRLILYPLSKKAIQNQRALQAFQPELDQIKEKYKDNKDKQTKETLAFYQKHKINPLSSCLPLLIQMPILIALYWVFRHAIAGTVDQLLYPFVHKPDTLIIKFLGIIDLTKPELYVLPVLAGASQFYQSFMILRQAKKDEKRIGIKEKKGPQDTSTMITKQMNYIFPIVTVIFAASLPAAISLYWVATNLFSILQQYIIMKDEKEKPKVIVRRK
ncbi:YidC/Oxa1 family membrane protein insertase [Patescibacteria group bacterium]|nr:YidC/Oxa1 family membrane protein insertase [Patescibacteria group bacterium]